MRYSLYKILFFSVIILMNQGCKESITESQDPEIPKADFEEIIIISPSGGAIYEPGDLLKIRWLSSSSLSKVDIYLLKYDDLDRTFVINKKNHGTYGWFIDEDIENSSFYSIKVVSSLQKENFSVSEKFSIKEKKRIKIRP